MTATVALSAVPDHKPGWSMFVNGSLYSGDWKAQSRFGSVESAVVLNPDGTPNFDRPLYREAANVNVVAWGRTAAGEVHLATISQPRPHADDPEQPGVNGHKPIVFGQIAMGFADKIFGEQVEKAEDAATREVGEEVGARVVKSVERPAYPRHNPNPTFVATWSDLLFVEVDLDQIEALRPNKNEPIFKAEFITVPELLRRIKEGRDADGAVYRMCTANSAWMIFFACHPELLTN